MSTAQAETTDTLVIGGGQAGLATSYWLKQAGVEHLVLERRRELGGSWHDRWDSFHLVAPNFTLSLPGMPYAGAAAGRLHAARRRRGVRSDGTVSSFDHRCDSERASTGSRRRTAVSTQRHRRAYSAPRAWCSRRGPTRSRRSRSKRTRSLPHIQQLHSHDYRRPAQLQDGGILVVGSGQSGAQIAEELQRAGRDVHLAVSMCGRAPRRYRGRDLSLVARREFPSRRRRSVSTSRRSPTCRHPRFGFSAIPTCPARKAGTTSICASSRAAVCTSTASSKRRAPRA